MTRVLICGDREWKDHAYIFDRLDDLRPFYGIDVVIEGCARGADRLAETWAKARNVPVEHFPAAWDKYGKNAGWLRNEKMLNAEPDLVIAFHTALQQSKGTAHMVKIAKAAGVQTLVFPHSHEGYRKP